MSGAVTHPVSETFPPVSFPTAFADGVLNASIAPGVVRFYLFRFEPSFKGDNQFQTQAVAQIVMPVEGFVAATMYLNNQITRLMAGGLISPERVEELRRAVDKGK
jgi:hypothetical protein